MPSEVLTQYHLDRAERPCPIFLCRYKLTCFFVRRCGIQSYTDKQPESRQSTRCPRAGWHGAGVAAHHSLLLQGRKEIIEVGNTTSHNLLSVTFYSRYLGRRCSRWSTNPRLYTPSRCVLRHKKIPVYSNKRWCFQGWSCHSIHAQCEAVLQDPHMTPLGQEVTHSLEIDFKVKGNIVLEVQLDEDSCVCLIG